MPRTQNRQCLPIKGNKKVINSHSILCSTCKQRENRRQNTQPRSGPKVLHDPDTNTLASEPGKVAQVLEKITYMPSNHSISRLASFPGKHVTMVPEEALRYCLWEQTDNQACTPFTLQSSITKAELEGKNK